MGTKSEALARQFESKLQEALATLQALGDADWTKVTEAEKWSVGVTAHHFASILEPVSELIRALANGHSPESSRVQRSMKSTHSTPGTTLTAQRQTRSHYSRGGPCRPSRCSVG